MIPSRRRFVLPSPGRTLLLDEATCIMGVLNCTPDSFSDGGLFMDPDHAADRARSMVDAGARIIDIGGESTRPGAPPVPPEEQCRRTLPVLDRLRDLDAVLSIDTTSAAVARAAVDAGAAWINDTSALCDDPEMAHVARDTGACVVLMHRRGLPATMQQDPRYDDVVAEIETFFRRRIADAVEQGIPEEKILLDPGIGFGKTLEHNLEILRRLHILAAIGRPLVVGVSRKAFLGALTGRDVSDRLSATLGACVAAAERGARILRVHDVTECRDALRVADALRETAEVSHA